MGKDSEYRYTLHRSDSGNSSTGEKDSSADEDWTMKKAAHNQFFGL